MGIKYEIIYEIPEGYIKGSREVFPVLPLHGKPQSEDE